MRLQYPFGCCASCAEFNDGCNGDTPYCITVDIVHKADASRSDVDAAPARPNPDVAKLHRGDGTAARRQEQQQASLPSPASCDDSATLISHPCRNCGDAALLGSPVCGACLAHEVRERFLRGAA